nr:twin-arginine translocase TatA/TatE family subunit [Subtercola boreus]
MLLAIVLLLFGAPKLPALARSVGQSMRILKTEVNTMHTETDQPVAESETTNETGHIQRDTSIH